MSAPVPVLLMVRELNVGGTERQCAELARALDPGRYQAHVACFRPSGFRADQLRAAGIPVIDLGVRSFASMSALAGTWRLRGYIRRHAIRVVHAFDYPMNLYAAPLARLFGVAVVLTSQRQSRSLYPGVRRGLRFTDRLADAVVVNCEAVREELRREDRLPERKLRLCYNGLDVAAFPPRAGEGQTLTVGVLCVFRPEKGLLTLIDAFHQVRERRAGIRLLLIGDGPLRPVMEQRIAELGMEPQCEFSRAVSDAGEWLRKLDIFVLPSLSEALSNSLMEAMSSGCACIASRTGGNPELIDGERTGLLFPPGNATELARALERLIVDDDLRRSMAAAASERVRREFSLERAAARLAEIYDEQLARVK